MRLIVAAILVATLGACTMSGPYAGGLTPFSVECKGKFQVSVVGPAGVGITGDCGDGASFTVAR